MAEGYAAGRGAGVDNDMVVVAVDDESPATGAQMVWLISEYAVGDKDATEDKLADNFAGSKKEEQEQAVDH